MAEHQPATLKELRRHSRLAKPQNRAGRGRLLQRLPLSRQKRFGAVVVIPSFSASPRSSRELSPASLPCAIPPKLLAGPTLLQFCSGWAMRPCRPWALGHSVLSLQKPPLHSHVHQEAYPPNLTGESTQYVIHKQLVASSITGTCAIVTYVDI